MFKKLILFSFIKKDFSVEDDLGVIAGNKASELFELCQRSDHQTPCKPGQKWHCIRDGFR